MRFQTLSVINTALLVAMLSGCGVGGGIIPNSSDSAQVSAATFWGSLGGTPANTHLSKIIGPANNEVGWTTFRKGGSSIYGFITPDGTLVVDAEGSLIGFNPDGSIRWQKPTIYSVGGVYMSNDGTICFQYNRDNFHLISQAGTLLLEYELDATHSELLNFGPDGAMYLLANEKTQPRTSLVAVNAQGEMLYKREAEIGSMRRLLALPNGQAAFLSAAGTITVTDANGNELWSDSQDDLQVLGLMKCANDRIYGYNYLVGDDVLIGYVSYSFDGTPYGMVEPQLSAGSFRLAGVIHSGNTIWTDKSNGMLAVVDPEGFILWQHKGGGWVSSNAFIGNHDEIYTLFRTGEPGETQQKLMGFNSSGEIIYSQIIDISEMVLPVQGTNGELFTYDRDKLFAYDPAGGLAWNFDFGGRVGSIAIGPTGTIYTTGDNILYANSPAGNELWRYFGPSSLGRLAVSGEGMIYTSTAKGILEITSDGFLSSEVELEDYTVWETSLSADGHMYTADLHGLVKAFWPGLTPSWEFAADENLVTRISVGEDETIYFGDSNGLLYAVDIGGQVLWTFDTLDRYVNTPAVTNDAVYVTSGAGGLFKLGLDGSQLWRFEPMYYCYAPPSIGPEGTVFIGTSQSRTPPPGNRPVAFNKLPVDNIPFLNLANRDLSDFSNDPVLLDPLGIGHGVYALSPEGTIKWNLHTSKGIKYPVLVDGESNVYLIISGQLFSINPQGRERWRYNTEFNYNTNLVIGVDGSIIFGAKTFLFSIGPGM